MSRLFGVAVVLFCFEIGLFLIIVPWSGFWETNLLFLYIPVMRPLMLSSLARVSVSCLGFVNCLIGVSELRRLFGSSPA